MIFSSEITAHHSHSIASPLTLSPLKPLSSPLQSLGYDGLFKQKSRESMGQYGKVRTKTLFTVKFSFYICSLIRLGMQCFDAIVRMTMNV